MEIDYLLALQSLDKPLAGFLVDEIFAHGQLDTLRQVLMALRQGIHNGVSTQKLLRMLKWPETDTS